MTGREKRLRKFINERVGVSFTKAAALAGMNRSTLTNKVQGIRPWYADELVALANALDAEVKAGNGSKLAVVDPADLVEIIGAKNVMLRGTLDEHTAAWC